MIKYIIYSPRSHRDFSPRNYKITKISNYGPSQCGVITKRRFGTRFYENYIGQWISKDAFLHLKSMEKSGKIPTTEDVRIIRKRFPWV